MTDKIKVAVLGLGGMGKTHVEAALESPYINGVYGYEPDAVLRNSKAHEMGIISASLEDIMANPEIKLVYIASPNEFHIGQAILAIRSGKAVLCEKPMGMNLAEAEKLLEAERETGKFLQIGFELHYSKMYQKVKEWITSGAIGTPVNIQCRYYCCEFLGKTSWRNKHPGSFMIGEKLSHYLDLQRWWFNDQVKSVYSVSSPNVVAYYNHHDNHQIITKFRNGGVGTLNFIMYIAESHKIDSLKEIIEKQAEDGHFLQYHVCGTRGAIETDVFRRKLKRWEFSDTPDGLYSKIIEEISFGPNEDSDYFHNTHGQNLRVAELVANNMPPEVSASDAFETMKLCFAAEESEETGDIVRM